MACFTRHELSFYLVPCSACFRDSPYLKLLLIGQLDFILLPKAFHAGEQLLWHNFSILWQLNSETIQWEDVGYKIVQYRSKKLSVLSLHQWGENAKLHVDGRCQLNWVITDTFRSIRSFSFFLAIINNTIYFYKETEIIQLLKWIQKN